MRLVKVTGDALTIRPRRRGKGFCYFDADGKLVCDDAIKARARSLGIPPAWEDVRIATLDNAHIQAMGRDAAGRTQYIYHPDWEAKRARHKSGQLSLLATALPRVRRKVALDLGAKTGSQELALAIAVALIDRTAMRVGRERYLESSGTRGAGTLFSGDARISGTSVALSFPAKSSKQAHHELHDKRLAAAIVRVKTLTGRRLLVYRDGDGEVRPISCEMINAYLESAADAHVTAKDFRTLHASARAGEALAQLEPGPSITARKRQMMDVTRQVAEFLRNTPAISRKSYIAPCLFKLFDNGKLQLLWNKGGRGRHNLRQRERRLGAVLSAAI